MHTYGTHFLGRKPERVHVGTRPTRRACSYQNFMAFTQPSQSEVHRVDTLSRLALGEVHVAVGAQALERGHGQDVATGPQWRRARRPLPRAQPHLCTSHDGSCRRRMEAVGEGLRTMHCKTSGR